MATSKRDSKKVGLLVLSPAQREVVKRLAAVAKPVAVRLPG
jgi:hypothetical protein